MPMTCMNIFGSIRTLPVNGKLNDNIVSNISAIITPRMEAMIAWLTILSEPEKNVKLIVVTAPIARTNQRAGWTPVLESIIRSLLISRRPSSLFKDPA
jgi:hypothetical protein